MICGWIKIIVAKSQQTNIHADLTGPTCVQTGSESDSGMSNERERYKFAQPPFQHVCPPKRVENQGVHRPSYRELAGACSVSC